MHWIDLNCDAGEGVGNESELFPHISSCNIASGGHAGDSDSMRSTVRLAMEHRVKIGAHPSYPDRENFGRVSMSLEPESLQESLQNQLNTFKEVIDTEKASLHHIKAHGALYNDLAGDESLGGSYLEVLEPYRRDTVLFAPCGSGFVGLAQSRGFSVWEEAFADRRYEPDGRLVSRKKQHAVLTDAEAVFEQLGEMVLNGRVKCADGTYFNLNPATYCLHGDTPNATKIVAYLTNALPGASIRIRK